MRPGRAKRLRAKLISAAAVMLICTAGSFVSAARPEADKAELENKRVEIGRFGVSFRAPRGWFNPQPEVMIDNIRKLDSGKEDIAAILGTNRGSLLVATYLKHNPRGHVGMIPTINVIGRPNPHNSFDGFREGVAAQSLAIGSTLRNYQVITPVSERDIAGRHVVYFAAEFDLSRQGGENYRISSTTYAIPCGELFLQISMSESMPVKHRAIFDEFISSFSFSEARNSKAAN